jgi:hypothetical protein
MIVWKVAAYCTQVEPDTLMVLSAVPWLRSSRAQDRMLAAGPLGIAYWTLVDCVLPLRSPESLQLNGCASQNAPADLLPHRCCTAL